MVFICVICYGCATTISRLGHVSGTELQQALSGKVFFSEDAGELELPTDDLLGLTPEVIAFVDQVTEGIHSDQRKLRVLLEAVFDSEHLALQFDDAAIFTALQVFNEHKANCLSFTTFMVPILRHMGINASFNEVEVPPVWDLRNLDTLILYQHVNVLIEWGDGSRQVVDINMREYELHYDQQIIADQVAEAQYFSNRAMQYLIEDRPKDAFSYLRKALDLAPEESFLWVNLGAIYRDQGELDTAEIAFRRALELAPESLIAISSLERVYRAQGKITEAGYLHRQAEHYRNNNPYYLYTQAMSAYVAHEYNIAMEYIDKAIRAYAEEHRFHFLQGAIYSALGDLQRARLSLERALELTKDYEQAQRYRNKFDMLF
jgi:Flp pilus assembly protein TadD